MIGIELDLPGPHGRIVEVALERGLIIRGRDGRLSFSPPR